MSDYLAGMTARSEHAQMNQSRQPVLDFDRRGYRTESAGIMQRMARVFQALRSLLPSLRAETSTHQIPSHNEAKSLAGGD